MIIAEAEKITGYIFEDKALLRRALTHSSYANEVLGDHHLCNERLEFLGDAVLGAIIADELFRRFPDKPEGELTRMRASVVCEKSLGSVAFSLGLNNFLLLGKGEELAGGRQKISIAADAVEAVIAAVYLDGGIAEAVKLVFRLLSGAIEEAAAGSIITADSKTELQELLQARGISDIIYAIVSEKGPDHAKTFAAEVRAAGELLGEGSGSSKKRAEAAAAEAALRRLSEA